MGRRGPALPPWVRLGSPPPPARAGTCAAPTGPGVCSPKGKAWNVRGWGCARAGEGERERVGKGVTRARGGGFARAPESLGFSGACGASSPSNGAYRALLRWLLSPDTNGIWGPPGTWGAEQHPCPPLNTRNTPGMTTRSVPRHHLVPSGGQDHPSEKMLHRSREHTWAPHGHLSPSAAAFPGPSVHPTHSPPLPASWGQHCLHLRPHWQKPGPQCSPRPFPGHAHNTARTALGLP